MVPTNPTEKTFKIGLALSGGGFRASIFHLGVIRRLEELGIMREVDVISAVSGGSIIAAYYVIEMEKRLRPRREKLKDKPDSIDTVRLKLFEDITQDFFKALDHNLRTRALIFGYFYHPLLFFKSWFPGYSRSDIIQKEYDKWFYHAETLDQLPSTMRRGPLAGSKLILNTTSLLTGKRVGFSREPISGFDELRKLNKNVLPLARIVGASAGVPGLFPPTSISGDLLVDGGVADNQGIEALLKDECDVLLVSDASGQMEQLNTLKPSAAAVLGRTNAIFQFQIRVKLMERLDNWKKAEENRREFAFIHLFLNLKDRAETPRVPSEYIPGIGRIRTDLDQFGFIEREALMYHGYSLMNAQIKKYCPHLNDFIKQNTVPSADLKRPPLFADYPASEQANATNGREAGFVGRRSRIKRVLEAGSRNIFLMRSLKKYWKKSAFVMILTWLVPVLLVWFGVLRAYLDTLADKLVAPYLVPWLQGLIPNWLTLLFTRYSGGYFVWPITSKGLTFLLVLPLLLYFWGFVTYLVMRRCVREWDLADYKRLTHGKEFSVRWE